MLGTIRYKFTKNTSGVAIPDAKTFLEMNGANDGDNKQFKFIKRMLATGDIGTAAGQTGHANGLIVDVIPRTYNILAALVFVIRKSSSDVGTTGMYTYDFVQNQIFHSGGAVTGESVAIYGVYPEDNSIRIIDKDPTSAVVGVKLDVGDIVAGLVVLGQAEDPLDLMNYA